MIVAKSAVAAQAAAKLVKVTYKNRYSFDIHFNSI